MAALHPPAAVAIPLVVHLGVGQPVRQHLAALLVVRMVAVAEKLYSHVVVPQGEPLEVQPKGARHCSWRAPEASVVLAAPVPAQEAQPPTAAPHPHGALEG